MSGYLDLAKRVTERAESQPSVEDLAERKQRKLEEAGRRGLIVRWSEYPDWLALHEPATGEWHEVRAVDCLPSLVEVANRGRRVTKKTKDTKKEAVLDLLSNSGEEDD